MPSPSHCLIQFSCQFGSIYACYFRLQQKKLPEYLQNPSVACVIGDADQIVAQGYTEAPVQDDTDLVRWFFTHLL